MKNIKNIFSLCAFVVISTLFIKCGSIDGRNKEVDTFQMDVYTTEELSEQDAILFFKKFANPVNINGSPDNNLLTPCIDGKSPVLKTNLDTTLISIVYKETLSDFLKSGRKFLGLSSKARPKEVENDITINENTEEFISFGDYQSIQAREPNSLFVAFSNSGKTLEDPEISEFSNVDSLKQFLSHNVIDEDGNKRKVVLLYKFKPTSGSVTDLTEPQVNEDFGTPPPIVAPPKEKVKKPKVPTKEEWETVSTTECIDGLIKTTQKDIYSEKTRVLTKKCQVVPPPPTNNNKAITKDNTIDDLNSVLGRPKVQVESEKNKTKNNPKNEN